MSVLAAAHVGAMAKATAAGGGGPPEVVAVSTGSTGGSNVNSVSCSRPAGTANGHLMLLALSRDGADSQSAPSGFSLIHGAEMGSHWGGAWSRTASGEPDNYQADFSSEQAAIFAMAISGHGGLHSSYTQAFDGSNVTEITVPSLTTPENDCLLVLFAFSEAGTSGITTPSGWTAQANIQAGTTTAGARLRVFSKLQESAGASGSIALTQSVSTPFGAVLVAVKPA